MPGVFIHGTNGNLVPQSSAENARNQENFGVWISGRENNRVTNFRLGIAGIFFHRRQ